MRSKRRVLFWIRRYLPNELAGTAVSLLAAGITLSLTSSLVAAAIAGTIGENIGFYGVAAARTIHEQWAQTAHLTSRRRTATLRRALWFSAIEFGPAEVLDTFAIRPLLLYLAPLAIGIPVLGWIVGKVLADIVFYAIAGVGYVVGRRVDAARPNAPRDDTVIDAATRAARIARVTRTADSATLSALATQHGTPLLLLEPARVEDQYRRLCEALPFVRFHYAVKAQGHPAVIETLSRCGSGFDVASDAEIDLLLRHGVTATRIIHTQPVKSPAEITHAYVLGIRTFVIDCVGELAKFRSMPGDLRLLIRLSYRNPHAKSDLSSKFGVDAAEAELLLAAALAQGTRIAGFSFHVGSQLDDVEPFRRATAETLALMERLEAVYPVSFDTIDIGGGFPAAHRRDTVTIDDIAAALRPLLEPHAERLTILAEPGRILVADAATLVTRVIGTRERGNENWVFIDDGLYGSYSNVFTENAHPVIVSHRELDAAEAELRPTVVAGPTCDSVDVVARAYPLPPLAEGDLLVSPAMGAYTTVTASDFNGRRRARILVLEPAVTAPLTTATSVSIDGPATAPIQRALATATA